MILIFLYVDFQIVFSIRKWQMSMKGAVAKSSCSALDYMFTNNTESYEDLAYLQYKAFNS